MVVFETTQPFYFVKYFIKTDLMLASFTCETFLTSYSLLKVEYDWDLNNNN